MSWSAEAMLEEVLGAPLGAHQPRPDTEVRRRPGWYQLVTPSARSGYLNEVYLPQLAPERADAVIDEVIGEYATLGIPMKWVLGPGCAPDDLAERLARRGLRRWLARGMACRLEDAAALADRVPDEPRVEEAAGAEGFAAYARVIGRGWDRDEAEVREDCRAAALASPRHRFFVAFAGDEPAGAGAYVERERSAYLNSAVVLPAWRGRGLYRALVAERLRRIAAEGRTLAVTHARVETSAPLLERLGFETVCTFELFAR
jgi:GNAT superfamily N-acetyltransferase